MKKLKVDKVITEGAWGFAGPLAFVNEKDEFEYTFTFDVDVEGKGHGWPAPWPGISIRQAVTLSYDRERTALIVHSGPQFGRGGIMALLAELYRYREKYGRLDP